METFCYDAGLVALAVVIATLIYCIIGAATCTWNELEGDK